MTASSRRFHDEIATRRALLDVAADATVRFVANPALDESLDRVAFQALL
jgi:hypothetical protein